uniref:Uncharacterized protein n=1 Tax=Octopus bimaculoides TaxID=37653 RepID=A0A0L8GJD1_OCTBM
MLFLIITRACYPPPNHSNSRIQTEQFSFHLKGSSHLSEIPHVIHSVDFIKNKSGISVENDLIFSYIGHCEDLQCPQAAILLH